MYKFESYFELNKAILREVEGLTDTDILIYSTLCYAAPFGDNSVITNLKILHEISHSTPINKRGLIKYKESMARLQSKGLIELSKPVEEIKRNTIIQVKFSEFVNLLFNKIISYM